MKDANFFLVARFSIEPQAEARFARERAPFEKHMRIERFSGEAEKIYAA